TRMTPPLLQSRRAQGPRGRKRKTPAGYARFVHAVAIERVVRMGVELCAEWSNSLPEQITNDDAKEIWHAQPNLSDAGADGRNRARQRLCNGAGRGRLGRTAQPERRGGGAGHPDPAGR